MGRHIIKALKLLFVLILLAIFAVTIQVWSHVQVGKGVARSAEKFERILPIARGEVLFTGDSTAFGTGVENKSNSTAGRFAKTYPDFSVYNTAVNGLKLEGLVEILAQETKTYDLIVMQIGANDVLRLHSFERIESDARKVVQKAKELSPNVVWLAVGNVGATRFFPWPLSNLYEYWSRNARTLFIRIAEEEGVYYVDLFREKEDMSYNPFHKDLYARDGLHLNDDGYGLWYEEIQNVIERHFLVKK